MITEIPLGKAGHIRVKNYYLLKTNYVDDYQDKVRISIMSEIKSINQKPYISVIIVAHNRKPFLKYAIESAINQTLGKNEYEIIVIKNFDDPEVDKLIKESNIISIKSSDECLVGDDLAIGLDSSRGEVIAFLDDDDTFLENKLEVIYGLFHKNEKIVYYHNAQIFKTLDGSSEPKFKNIRACFPNNYLILKFKKIVRKYTLSPLIFNISSISIRKSHYVKYIDSLKSLANHTDDFFFFVGLDAGGIYYLDDRKLTVYLRHQSASKAILKQNDKLSFLLKKADIQEKGALASKYILGLVNDERLKNIIKARMELEQLSNNIYMRIFNKNLLLKCIWNSRYYGFKHTILELYLVIKDLLKE